MKTKLTLLILAAAVLPASATVTLNAQFGSAFDKNGVVVPAGTLWALVVDTAANGFTGFNTGSSLALQAAGTADTYFTSGQSLALGGSLNGDTIFAIGGFSGAGPGITASGIDLTYGVNGTAAGRNYAFFWFPGATFTGGATETIGSQVGGINSLGFGEAEAGFEIGMVLPNDGALLSTGAATAAGGGTIADSTFRAVSLVPAIPEPSAALLGALGALGLLRRRRN